MSRWAQIDVIDGKFCEGKSFELENLKVWEWAEKMLWDIHLMVKEPIKWIEKCMFVGASRIVGQVEMMDDLGKFVSRIKDMGLEAGVAFDIGTKIEKVPKDTDWVLLMGRKAGFGQFELDKLVFEKIVRVKEMGFKVSVDGGVDAKNIRQLEEAGVDIIYSGSNFIKIYADRNRN